MENNALLVLLLLLLAHVVTDFVLQPTKWVAHKRKYEQASIYLYVHSFLAGLLTYLFLHQWDLWLPALFISITHFFIDWWKLRQKDNLQIFLLDQFFHFLVLLIVWLYLIEGFGEISSLLNYFFSSPSLLAVSLAYLLVIFPVGFIIGKATERWQDEIEISNQKTSLKAAGRYIGIFERVMVLTLILTDNFAAIGFLIAAKSILRFNEKAESGARKQTEYVLIGTLMSFAITIIIGFLVRQIWF